MKSFARNELWLIVPVVIVSPSMATSVTPVGRLPPSEPPSEPLPEELPLEEPLLEELPPDELELPELELGGRAAAPRPRRRRQADPPANRSRRGFRGAPGIMPATRSPRTVARRGVSECILCPECKRPTPWVRAEVWKDRFACGQCRKSRCFEITGRQRRKRRFAARSRPSHGHDPGGAPNPAKRDFQSSTASNLVKTADEVDEPRNRRVELRPVGRKNPCSRRPVVVRAGLASRNGERVRSKPPQVELQSVQDRLPRARPGGARHIVPSESTSRACNESNRPPWKYGAMERDESEAREEAGAAWAYRRLEWRCSMWPVRSEHTEFAGGPLRVRLTLGYATTEAMVCTRSPGSTGFVR